MLLPHAADTDLMTLGNCNSQTMTVLPDLTVTSVHAVNALVGHADEYRFNDIK